MMRRLKIFALLMIRCLPLLLPGSGSFAHAANYPIPAGASTATIQSTINTAAAASGGNTVTFAAGPYSITSQISIPCPASALTIQGPTPAGVGTTWPITPTAILTSTLTNNWAFSGTACSVGTTIQYLQYNGGLPSGGGGGFLSIPPGLNNLTVAYNWFYGNNAVQQSTRATDMFIYLNGSLGGSPNQNVTIQWNRFGQVGGKECGGNGSDGNPAGSNGGLMNLNGDGTASPGHCSSSGYAPPSGTTDCLYQGASDITHGGGSCGAIGVQNNFSNLIIKNNSITDQEQGLKFYECSGSGCSWSSSGLVVQYNDIAGIHRIGAETQFNDVPSGTFFTYDSNDYRDPIKPNAGTWGLSLPQGTTNSTNNVLIANVVSSNDKNGQPGFYSGNAIEFWGTGTSSNNLIQGFWHGGIGYGFGGPPRSINNNTIQGGSMGSNFIFNEEGTTPPPSQTGNITGTTVTAVTSIAPTISPSPGGYSSPLTVTLTDPGYTSGAVPHGNTSIWYTTDGSTPNPSGASTAAQYYLSPSGSDANPGTLASPWLSPNHAVNCGDTITAAAGTYSSANFNSGKWGAVNCSAGNSVAWLKCATFDACKISSTTTSAMHIDKSFWGVQGWEVTTSANANATGFQIEPAASTVIHHIILANNVVNGAVNGGISAYNNGTSGGSDYLVFVGNVVYNAASTSAVCASGINIYEPIASDANAGTHIYVAGNFSYGNMNPSVCNGGSPTDGEGIIFDTFDGHQNGTPVYKQQAVIQNNIAVNNGGRGIQVEYNNVGTPANAHIFVKFNTTYGNEQDVNQPQLGFGECIIQASSLTSFTNNLCATSAATDPAGKAVYALAITSGDSTDTMASNWGAGIGGNNTFSFSSGSFAYGSNVLGTGPAFSSTTIPGAPSCSGKANVPACMSTLIANFTPTASGATAYGYQTPSLTPVTDGLFPQWVCNVSLPPGLVSTPCTAGNTTKLYTVPIIVSLPATINAIGMWGALNQPKSYPSGYGFVPSAVVTASYTSIGGVTLSSVSIAPTAGVSTLLLGGTVQMIVTCHYSDGSTSGCNTTDSRGNSVTNWTSSNGNVTVSSSGLATGAAIGTADITATVTGGFTTSPAATLTVSAPSLTLSSVSIATAGGVSSINTGTTNQLITTCHYSDGSTSPCNTTDSHGNAASSYNSSAPAIATVTTGGTVTGVAAGSTNLTASVTPAPSMLGTNLQNVLGATGNGYINEIYGVTGTSPGNYTPGNCHIIIPATTWVAGKLWTCLLVLGTPTTQNASALCSNSYTTTGTSWPGGDLIISMASCPALPPDQGYWVGSTTNQTTASPTQGFSNCSASCSGAPPTFGSGTYAYRYVANAFGNYTSLPTTLSASAGTLQVSQYIELTTTPVMSANLPLSITTPPPSLVSAYLTASSGSMTVGGTMQMAAKCHYTSGPDQDCTVADIYGDAVSAWLSSDPTKATVNNVGASNPGLVTAVAAGTPSITATIGTGTTSSAYPITINNPPVTLTGVSLSLTGGVTGLFVGATNHLKATCTYSDGSSDDCTTTDVHGYLAHNYASTTPAHATVNATSGLVTGVAPGATTFTAVAGSFTSNALPLNVFPVLSGVYTITVSGPVKFSGTVQF